MRGAGAEPRPEGLTQQQVVRRCILESILESEKNYLEALKRILELYERPLLAMEPALLSERKLKVAFHRVREILQCHALFQIALASRVAEWDAHEMIGDVFVASRNLSSTPTQLCATTLASPDVPPPTPPLPHHAHQEVSFTSDSSPSCPGCSERLWQPRARMHKDFLQVHGAGRHSEYVNNFSTAMGVLKRSCASKPAFLEFLKHCQDSSSDRLTLYGLMMKPIQRFPQFILLLQDMLKNTPVGHADRLPLQMALTELETLAEKLNERKREADQRCEVKHIAKAMNERYLNKLLSSESRYLIRSDEMVETVYNDRGEMIKTKERRLFLLNDVLMGSQDSGGGASVGHKLLLKWSVPLSLVEVVEFGSSEEAATAGRFLPPHSGENVVINARPNKLYMGPGQLYQDLQNLVYDLGLVKQISGMVSSLKGNYQNVNSAVAQDWVSGLQRLILRKEEEIRAADRCRVQLQLPGKHDKSGRPTHFSAVFNTFTPAIKQSWISNLQMAKLALEEDNLQGWFFAEDDGNQMKKRRHPLLLRQMPVVMSKLQEFKVECAVHSPEPLFSSESTADTPALGHGCVWVASCTNQMGQISVVTLQSPAPKVTECFNVESRILCMVHVPPAAPGTPTPTPTVCLGMEEGSISVYKSSQRYKKIRLQHFFTPEKSTVTSLVYRGHCLYAGLVSGSVAIFSRSPDGSWCPDSPQVVKLGVLPVKSMLAMEDHVWASSGGQVFILCTKTHAIQRQLEVHQEEGMVVSHMVVAGVGVWIAFSSRSTLRLFHTETLEHLQDINIATPVHHTLPGQQRVTVSSLLVCPGLLLVGTSLGVTVALSVPRLQGIPKVSGRGMVSFHAHNGPVKFLTMAAAVYNRPQHTDRPPSAPHPHRLPGAQPRGRGDLRPAERPSPHALGPPRCREDRRVGAGRVRGAGHRRVNRKTKQSRQEEAVATIMVWQIPFSACECISLAGSVCVAVCCLMCADAPRLNPFISRPKEFHWRCFCSEDKTVLCCKN
ncbi:hypothetical protein AAFF_G00298550 [Aldrovandia affinis]|uniref:DH domain-containing protein n=1 Tax=Aldrovandia affinis TaxID=143900 RepID=A0AAD7W173_9TELE|nr:hypothetical protein AAFF_G00298550 [Aldrovandia affinis]